MDKENYRKVVKICEKGPEIVVLQIMVFGNDELLVEYVCEQELIVE